MCLCAISSLFIVLAVAAIYYSINADSCKLKNIGLQTTLFYKAARDKHKQSKSRPEAQNGLNRFCRIVPIFKKNVRN